VKQPRCTRKGAAENDVREGGGPRTRATIGQEDKGKMSDLEVMSTVGYGLSVERRDFIGEEDMGGSNRS